MQVELESTRVFIGNVSNGYVSAEFVRSLISMIVVDTNKGWGFWRGILWGRSGVNIIEKRNEIIRQFLKTDGDWLLLLDSDMVFPEDIMPRMLHAAKQADTKVIGGLCVVVDEKTGPYPTLFHMDGKDGKFLSAQLDYPTGAILEVIATGAACLLVHREVLEAVRDKHLKDRDWLFEHKDDPFLKELNARGLVYPPTENHGWFSERPVVMYIKGQDGEKLSKERWVGEDIDFCLRIGALGYKIFVDCGLEIGHHKEDRVWYPRDIKEGVGFRRPPVAVIIPVKDNLEMTSDLVDQIRKDRHDEIIICDNGSGEEMKSWLASQDDITIIDCPDIGINAMWNRAIEHALKRHGHRAHVAILNNDIKLGEGFLDNLSLALYTNSEMVAVSGNYDERMYHSNIQEVHDICAARYDGTGGLAGFAFMVRGEWFASGYKFPEECMWWYGDNDLMVSIEIANALTKDIPRRAGIVINASVEHLEGGGRTAGDPMWSEFQAQIERDGEAFQKVYEKKIRGFQLAQARMSQQHVCSEAAIEIMTPYLENIPADKLPFITDLEQSVKAFPRQWDEFSKLRVSLGDEDVSLPSMVKIMEDIQRYEKIIADTQPEIIVECGTWTGGSAEWLAGLVPEVITIDIEDHVSQERKEKLGDRVHWLQGSSLDDAIVDKVKGLVGEKRCMVILDSDHHACHVLSELHLYKDLVSDGCYMVVEDGIVRWVHITDHASMIHHGPMEAIENFLALNKDFERDEVIEIFELNQATMHPSGFLKKVV